MSEHSSFFRILMGPESNPFEEEQRIFRQNLPLCNFEELKNIDINSDSSVRSSAVDFDEFLKEKFKGIGILGFMEIYSKLHIGEAFCLPVPPEITCVFKNEAVPEKLANFLSDHQPTIGTNPATGRTFLNLHDNTVYEFTLIRADFDIEENAKHLWRGYHHKNDNFAFFIKSSAQFDLTVVYNIL